MSRRVRTATAGVRTLRADTRLPGYVMCGILAGLLPLWNGAAFVAAAAMLGTWLVLFPERLYVVALGLVAASIGLPQLLLLGGAADASDAYPRVHWGYVVSDPTPVNVAVYVAFLFGPKLLLSVAALRRGTRRQRRVFLAFASLFAVAFLFQLSIEVFNNHKLINAWLVAANLFAAGGLVHLWRSRRTMLVPARLIAVALSAILVAGGLIDLIPIRNQGSIEYATDGDPLFEWLRAGTEKDAVFLSHVHVSHPITLAGRRLWLGHTFYAYSAGYDVGAREREYRDLFALRSARELGVRLRANDIQYVAFDDALRNEGFAPRINEELYRSYFEAVFVDTARRYSNLVIYRVPELASATALPGEPATNMYTGGAVDGRGLLDAPVGLAVDRDGTLLVADSGNGRIQRFSTNGNFVETIAGARSGGAELERPLGVASDACGLLYVADPGTGRVTTFDAAGNVVSTSSDERTESWEPVDVAVIGDQVLVVDSLMGAVLRLNADGSTASWSDQ
ncbi:MAG TPA: hypothetical protein VK356_06080, partial [Thermomicrobiales bacterium]|nr:hypothetical protein [Thermomicrobiales bacterium]